VVEAVEKRLGDVGGKWICANKIHFGSSYRSIEWLQRFSTSDCWSSVPPLELFQNHAVTLRGKRGAWEMVETPRDPCVYGDSIAARTSMERTPSECETPLKPTNNCLRRKHSILRSRKTFTGSRERIHLYWKLWHTRAESSEWTIH